MKTIKLIPAVLICCVLACCKKDNDSQTLSDADRQFMVDVSHGNNAEVDAGSAASTMASVGSVKSFGSMMVTDHTKAQSDMVTLGTQVGKTDLPTTPDSTHMRMKMMLMTLSGRAFDSTYMQMQVSDHMTTIKLMQSEITNGSDQRVKDYANSHLPVVQMHKQMADSIVAANRF